jgi:hypothetical protein
MVRALEIELSTVVVQKMCVHQLTRRRQFRKARVGFCG